MPVRDREPPCGRCSPSAASCWTRAGSCRHRSETRSRKTMRTSGPAHRADRRRRRARRGGVRRSRWRTSATAPRWHASSG